MDHTNRIDLALHDAVDLALESATLRGNGIEHNLFMLIGKPGAGKTRLIENKVKGRGWGFLTYSPALERIEKFGGIPEILWKEKYGKNTDGENEIIDRELHTVWSVPQMIWEINQKADTYPVVIVLLDDWHLCDSDLQAIGFELFTYYTLNGHKIRDNVVFILAGNESSAAGAKIQMSAIRNRSTLIFVEPDVEYWLRNFAIANHLHPLGISFFQNKANQDLFQEQESTVEQFGSARSWTSAFNLIKAMETNRNYHRTDDETGNLDLPRHFVQAIFQGSVSMVATERFMTHYDIYSKINLHEIFDKKIINIPSDPVERYCYSAASNYEFYRRYVNVAQLSNEETTKIREACVDAYVMVLTKLEKFCQEIASMTIVNLGNIPKNEKLGTPSGMEIIIDMLKHKKIDAALSKKLVEITKLLR
jgi:hypothetical protein